MDEKIPVIIEPMQRISYGFRNLDYCKQCGSYTTLKEDRCLKCKGDKFISFETMIDEMYSKRKKKEILFLLNIFLVFIILGGVVFSVNVKDLMIALVVLISCMAIIMIIQQRFSEKLRIFEIHETIEQERHMIERSMERDYQRINHLLESQEHLDAYKALRNIGTIVKKEYIKAAKIHCLSRFIIRSDMPLEMEELLVESYNKNLVEYIYEVAKLQRGLIKQPTIEYIMQHEESIQGEFGKADLMLGTIAGAAIYSKNSIDLNKEFISSYIDYIPKDRVERIQRLLYDNKNYEWDTLQEAILNMKGPSYEDL